MATYFTYCFNYDLFPLSFKSCTLCFFFRLGFDRFEHRSKTNNEKSLRRRNFQKSAYSMGKFFAVLFLF